MESPERAVVVGIGSDGYDSALLYAVDEVRRSHCPCTSCTCSSCRGRAAHRHEPGCAPARPGHDRRCGPHRDDAGRERCDRPGPGERLAHGASFPRSASADQLLVLQHRSFTQVHRIFTGSVVQSVPAWAQVPVVSVHEGWTPRVDVPPVVTAAVQDAGEASGLLQVAFEAACLARQRWSSCTRWMASGVEVVVVDDSYRAEWTDRSVEEMTVLSLSWADPGRRSHAGGVDTAHPSRPSSRLPQGLISSSSLAEAIDCQLVAISGPSLAAPRPGAPRFSAPPSAVATDPARPARSSPRRGPMT